MAPDGSPLAVLAQQGAEVANLIVAEKSIGVPRREPFVGGNDQARLAQSEAASSASPNHRLSEHDARRCITQSHAAQEYDRVNEMTSATLLKIGDVSGTELHPHRDGL
jgi:hypothetical protein